MMKTILPLTAGLFLLLAGCGPEPGPEPPESGPLRYIELEVRGNRVRVPEPEPAEAGAPPHFTAALVREGIPDLPDDPVVHLDSLTLARYFPLGGGAALAVTGFAGSPGRLPGVRTALEESVLEVWPGLRSVTLSSTTPGAVDSLRNRAPRHPPLMVHHSVDIGFFPESSDSSLLISDTLFFSGRDSVVLSVHPEIDPFFEPLSGRVSRISHNRWLCLVDSSLAAPGFTGVFRTVIPRNRQLTDPATGELLLRNRMNSSLIGGRYLPVGEHPNRYRIRVSAPADMGVFTPLPGVDPPDYRTVAAFSTGTGLVRGVVPVFIGDFEEVSLSGGRTRLLYQLGIDEETLEHGLHWAGNLSDLLQARLAFQGSGFSILLIHHPDHFFAVPYHGCLVVSPEALESLSGVFTWGDSLASGVSPRGTEVAASAAACFTLQSIHLDPVLARMIRSWIPCVFMAAHGAREDVARMRRAYRTFYLYETETIGGYEHALADPLLRNSPLYDPVVLGKGPMVLEYLDSEGCLERLPELLDNFRHTGSYWPKLHTNLGFFPGDREFKLIRELLYTPGIPQVEAEWWAGAGVLRIKPRQMQPAPDFTLQFRSAVLFFENDDPLQIPLQEQAGSLYGGIPSRATEPVTGIHLNPEELIPADIIYRRRVEPFE